MTTKTLTRDSDTEPVPYVIVENGEIKPAPEPDEFVIEMPNGRLRCSTLADADDTRPTGPIVYRGTVAEAWQELKNYRRAIKDTHGLREFRPHLLSWPDCQPVRRPSVASRVRPQVRARRPRRQAVAR